MEREAIIGIDGGGTGSRGIVAGRRGDLLAEAEGGPLNPYVLPPEAVDRNLRDLIGRLLAGTGLTSDRIRGVGAGLSGVRTPSEGEAIRSTLAQVFPGMERIQITHDLGIALRGGAPDGTGIVTVIGTGSSAFGRYGGRTALAGGWGHVMGDDGSGYWIGVRALRAVAQAVDGRGKRTDLTKAICEHLDADTPRDLVPWSIRATKAEIAALAEIVLEQAGMGDGAAGEILASGATEIARMASAVHRRLGIREEPVTVVLSGGLMEGAEGYFEACRDRIVREIPEADVVRPLKSPAWGAVELAMEEMA